MAGGVDVLLKQLESELRNGRKVARQQHVPTPFATPVSCAVNSTSTSKKSRSQQFTSTHTSQLLKSMATPYEPLDQTVPFSKSRQGNPPPAPRPPNKVTVQLEALRQSLMPGANEQQLQGRPPTPKQTGPVFGQMQEEQSLQESRRQREDHPAHGQQHPAHGQDYPAHGQKHLAHPAHGQDHPAHGHQHLGHGQQHPAQDHPAHGQQHPAHGQRHIHAGAYEQLQQHFMQHQRAPSQREAGSSRSDTKSGREGSNSGALSQGVRHQLHVDVAKRRGMALGASFTLSGLLIKVEPQSAAWQAGLHHHLGYRLTHINGTPVASYDVIRECDVLRLTFDVSHRAPLPATIFLSP